MVDSGALQCGGLSPPHTPIFVSSSASLLKGKGTSGEVCLSLRQEDSLHQKGDRDRARVRSSPASESSATRSSLITILLLLPVFCRGKERFKGRLALGVLGSEDPEVTNQPCPSEGSLRENKWRYDRRGQERRERLGPWGGAHPDPPSLLSSAARSSVSTILLLLPVFSLQPASRPDPETTSARYYSDVVQVYSEGVQLY